MQVDTRYLKEVLLFIIILGVVVLFILSIKLGCKESWVNFMNVPYGQAVSASSTLDNNGVYVYPCPEYRLPYNWPLGVKTEHPFPHVAPLKMGTL